MNDLLRDVRRDVGVMQGAVGKMEGAILAITARQDRHEAITGKLDEKIDQVLANQERAALSRAMARRWLAIAWTGLAAVGAFGGWLWDHFGGK